MRMDEKNNIPTCEKRNLDYRSPHTKCRLPVLHRLCSLSAALNTLNEWIFHGKHICTYVACAIKNRCFSFALRFSKHLRIQQSISDHACTCENRTKASIE